MADMEHLFREQELAGIRTGRFKTAPDRAEKAQYNMRVRTDKAEAGRVMVYAGRVPGNAKEVTTITIYRKSGPQRRADLSGVGALRLIGELEEALKL